MTTYLLETSLSLLLTFSFYKVALENQPMHGFKRFYLLGSLLFSALVPLVSFEVETTTALVEYQPARVFQLEAPTTFQRLEIEPEPVGFNFSAYYATCWLWLYGLVSMVLIGRFIGNLRRLVRQISSNPQQPFQGAILVRLPTDTLPYTFLHYLFVSEVRYQRGEIEDELFTHELTHIRQRHSLDVLLLEALLCLAWFNPLLYAVKRAMQLNHEFLADEAVNGHHQNVPHYQHLLLSKLTSSSLVSLTSALTFQTTKKRLLMMTKRTTRIRAWLAGGSAALLLGVLTFLLGTTTEPAISSASKNSKVTQRQSFKSEAEKVVHQHGDMLVTPLKGKGTVKKYSKLSAEEKQWVIVRRPNYFMPLRIPSEAQWTAWRNPEKYSVSVHSSLRPEGIRLKNNELTTRQRTDMAYFVEGYDRTRPGEKADSTRRLIVMWTKGRREEILKEQHPDTLPQLFLSKPAVLKSQPQLPITEPEKNERLYGNMLVRIPGQKERRYSELSSEEKKRTKIVEIPLQPRRMPTEAQWAEWKNPHKFGIWVDNKRIRGQALNAYQRTDIASFSGSYVHKNARQPEGYSYQMDLMTTREYEKYSKEPRLYYGIMTVYKDEPKN